MSASVLSASKLHRAALAAFCVLSVYGSSAAPATAQETPGVFGETIDVRVVNVEVVVTDKDGIRVTGLGPDDFRLTVDGEPTAIDFFTEVRGGDAVAAEAGAGAPVPGLPALAAGERVGTSYLVFIDDFFAIARDRDQVIEGLIEQLPTLGVEDRMAVVAYDGREISMLTSWSGSQRVLEKALKEAMRRPALGLQRLAERRSHDLTTRDVRTGRASLAFSQSFRLSVEERVYAGQLAEQVQGAVGAAAATLRGFASPPGRKVMLLLSGGWPYSPAYYAVDDLTRPLSGEDVPGGAKLYAPLTDTANLLGYTVYPVDVPGMGNDFDADVAEGGRLVGSGSGEGRFADNSVAGSRDRERDVQQALHHVADETGGTALINARRMDALPQVVSDTRSYYWIGFSPARRRDDGAHDIQVEPLRPGLKVRSREGFRDLSRGAENDMAVESALLFGDAPTSGSLAVALGEISPAGRKEIEVPVTLTVPLDLMTLVPVDGGWATAFELRVAALDAGRRRSDIPRIPVELKFKQRPPAGAAVPYQTRLKLRRERQTVVLSVLDPIGGASLTGRLEIAP